jgi:outer membrane lipoprotein-sorting protein
MKGRRAWALGLGLACGASLGGVLTGSGTGHVRSASAEPAASQPSPRQIMERVAETRRLEGSEAVVTMRMLDDAGQSRERKLTMATRLYDEGQTEKRIYRFLSPPDVKGTGVLIFDYAERDDDVWVYLPALRKTRRITSSQRSKSFMGSEFSYGDLNVPSIDDFTYALKGQEPVDGEPCWQIEVLPKSPEVATGEGYSRKTYWVSQKTFSVRRGLYYDLDGKLLKELLTDGIQLLDPDKKRYRASRMEMKNAQNGRRSVFESEKMVFSPKAKDEYFTTSFLERP